MSIDRKEWYFYDDIITSVWNEEFSSMIVCDHPVSAVPGLKGFQSTSSPGIWLPKTSHIRWNTFELRSQLNDSLIMDGNREVHCYETYAPSLYSLKSSRPVGIGIPITNLRWHRFIGIVIVDDACSTACVPLSTNRQDVLQSNPWSLEASRLDVIMIVSLWNLTSISAVLLPNYLSNFRVIKKV